MSHSWTNNQGPLIFKPIVISDQEEANVYEKTKLEFKRKTIEEIFSADVDPIDIPDIRVGENSIKIFEKELVKTRNTLPECSLIENQK
jgi:hypothetical protein